MLREMVLEGTWHPPHKHHNPTNLSQSPALANILKKKNKIKPNQSSAQDEDGSVSMWAG